METVQLNLNVTNDNNVGHFHTMCILPSGLQRRVAADAPHYIFISKKLDNSTRYGKIESLNKRILFLHVERRK